jgi:hypothetical protein
MVLQREMNFTNLFLINKYSLFGATPTPTSTMFQTEPHQRAKELEPFLCVENELYFLYSTFWL